MQPFPDQPSIDERLLARLGFLITRFALLESQIGEFLSYLLEANPGLMYVITQSVSASSQVGWVRTLVEMRIEHDPSREKIIDLLDRIKSLQADRNALVHGLWSTATVAGAVIVQTVKLDRRELVKHELITTADLDELIHDVIAASQEMLKIGQNLGFLK